MSLPTCFERLPLQWQVAPHSLPEEIPTDWIPATVPGAVQLDWARAKNWPDYWKAENFRAYDGLEDRYWTYRAAIPACALPCGSRLFFVCGGVDYQYEIFLNGEAVHEHEGMLSAVDLDLTDRLGGTNEIMLRVHPAPKSQRERADRTQANLSCKPAVSYEWDFHPRLIPPGIWEEAYLEIRSACRMVGAETNYTLSDDFSRADLRATVDISHPGETTLRWRIYSPFGDVLADVSTPPGGGEHVDIEATVKTPALWWPHDQGSPALHVSRLELCDTQGRVLQSQETRMGFRRVRLVMAPDQWKTPKIYPMSRSTPPMTLEINGRTIFSRGTNWVSPEIFPGLLNRDTYVPLLQCAVSANMNLVRLWGGATAQKESFYSLCDEMGLLVWQEFPLAGNFYPDDPDYLRVLDTESRALIRRVKPHACLVIWCGGNELFNHWSGMTDQSLAIRLLGSNCYLLDPSTPFLPTSPVDGVSHGHYVFRDPVTGDEAWALFQNSQSTAYCEFGMPGPASMDVLREIIPEDELSLPQPGGAWEAHHAFGVWMQASHLYPGITEHYFGKADSLEQLVEHGQLLQCEGIKGLFEEARRQKPNASMALNWCLNEPWPTAANNSLISWPCRPKPALAAAGQACRPVLASARIKKFQWTEGEIFDPELFWLNDAPVPGDPGIIEARIETPTGVYPLLTWTAGPLAANTNLRGPQIRWQLPNLQTERFFLILSTPGRTDAGSRYTLLFKSLPRTQAPATAVMNQALE